MLQLAEYGRKHGLPVPSRLQPNPSPCLDRDGPRSQSDEPPRARATPPKRKTQSSQKQGQKSSRGKKPVHPAQETPVARPESPIVVESDSELQTLKNPGRKSVPQAQGTCTPARRESPIIVDSDSEEPQKPTPRKKTQKRIVFSEDSDMDTDPLSQNFAPSVQQTQTRAESLIQVIEPEHQSSTAANPAAFRRHETFWFADGSLFLQLAGVRFKMHRSRLRRASAFLEQLFAIREDSFEEESMNIALNSGDALKVGVPVEEVAGLDLYILDGIGVKLADFEVLMNAVDSGLEYVYTGRGASQVQVQKTPSVAMLVSTIRAATTLQCESIRSWAIACIQEIWTWSPEFDFRKSLLLVDASEILNLPRTHWHKIPATVLARTLYELLRSPHFDDKNMDINLLIPRRRLNDARGKLQDAWVSIAADALSSVVLCPCGVPPPCESSSADTDDTAFPPAHCISQSPSDVVRDIHIRTVHTSLLDNHLSDPLGGLDALIAMEEVWLAEGYCPGCVYLRRKLWKGKKDKLMSEMFNVWFQDLMKK
ncbi:hypothetical protein MSAN_00074800 [Mycena sanguinolenta]|uniref:BTB domain-containing protein n=1 Tax=Mycena sanguinolenta TaxID=230812 RepID=A0A8H7DIF4_9AGAR|nr:hypothetical protein MSAN_00074800 [Mycena sanguinolenta]